MKNLLDEFSNENYKDEQNENQDSKKKLFKPKSSAFKNEDISFNKDLYVYKSKRLKLVVFAICFLASLIFIYSSLFNYITVNDFTSETESSATKWAEDKKIEADFKYVSSNEQKLGIIISQNVEAGTKIRKRDRIEFQVSTGPNMEEVIDLNQLKKMNINDAKDFVDKNKLTNLKIKTEFSETINKDDYISAKFEDEGVELNNYIRENKGSLFYSKGNYLDVKSVIMNNNIGSYFADVEMWSKENKVYAQANYVDSKYPADVIISQDVKADEYVNEGSIIKYEVSKGPGIKVVNFNGLNQQEAQEVANENKLGINIVENFNDNVASGSLIKQSILEGEAYHEGDSITLYYSIGKPYIDNYKEQPSDALVSSIKELNKLGSNISYKLIYVDSDLPSGSIVSHSSTGKYVNTSSHINIKVSK